MLFIRVDNRLVHGQIIAAWLPALRAQQLIVANDEVAQAAALQQIFRLTIPSAVSFEALSLEQLEEHSVDDTRPTLLLLENVADALRLFDAGFQFSELNLGNLQHAPGTQRITNAVHLSADDQRQLAELAEAGVRVFVQTLPSEDPIELNERLEHGPSLS